MQQVVKYSFSQEYSIYNMENIFWKQLQLNIYNATIPD
jgi:hypothetical protein